jgi:hypothetical protein
MHITDINPDEGPTTGGILVTITGEELPSSPSVYFADRSAEVVSAVAGSFIVVDVPAGQPGSVDVTVTDRTAGELTTFASGFTYIAPGVEPEPTTTTMPATTSTTAGSTAPTTTTAIPTTTTTSPSASPPGGSLDDWLDSVLQTPEGLTLAPPAPGDPIGQIPASFWAGALCDQPVCPGWVLED